MGGICGMAWTDSGQGPTPEQLTRMFDRLRHRGPDDAGSYRDDHAALGFRRLAILDLEGDHQPFSNEDGTVWVVFNGEIYNFRELRRRLEARGHRFRSSGDTEVLVHLYEDEGLEMFAQLRGMFALAIWDKKRRRLLLGRDRLGQKPLIYHLTPNRISFASELKALLTLPEADLPRQLNARALDRYLTYGYIPAPETILEGVQKLPPAHLAIWRDGHFQLQRYWEPDWNAINERPLTEDLAQLRQTLDEAVREQMVSDVPLGAFLSGGVDSTIIAGLMQRASGQPLKTFSIGFDDPAFDESHFAQLAADHLGTEHHAFRIQPQAWETLPALAEQLDEPFADSSVLPTWEAARQARQEITVALTGDAGDELFGGYDRYRALALTGLFDRWPQAFRRFLGGPLARTIPASAQAKTRLRRVRRLLEGFGEPPARRYLGWLQTFDEPARNELYSNDFRARLAELARSDPEGADPFSVLQQAWDQAHGRDPLSRAMVVDLLTYLPGDILVKVDQASMAHGLECRSPFLDHRVVELALGLPLKRKMDPWRGRSKIVLKEAFADLLPEAIRHRPKMGFGVPIDRWFRTSLKGELRDILLDPSTIDRGLFRAEIIERLLNDHIEGRRDHAYRLWALLMLELWFRNHLGTQTSG